MTNQSIRSSRAKAGTLPIHNVLKRLSNVGYSKEFIRNKVLPAWWDDELSQNPAEMAIAEVSIFRHLGIPIKAIRNQAETLLPEINISDYRFKKMKSTGVEKLRPALGISQSVAKTLTAIEMDLDDFTVDSTSALTVRKQIMHTGLIVNLETLLTWAWVHGIIVAHILLPKELHKFVGLAIYVDDHPVILFGSSHDSPPWLAFHLAHELGHLLLGHVKPGRSIVDMDVQLNSNDHIDSPEQFNEEFAANEFALELLTGRKSFDILPIYGLTCEKLVALSQSMEVESKINAGTFALVYGQSANRMGVAQKALKDMNLASGGKQIVKAHLQRHLPDDLSESIISILKLTGIEHDNAPCLLHSY